MLQKKAAKPNPEAMRATDTKHFFGIGLQKVHRWDPRHNVPCYSSKCQVTTLSHTLMTISIGWNFFPGVNMPSRHDIAEL